MSHHSPRSGRLVRLAYRLDESRRYQTVKGFFHSLLEDRNSRRKGWFDLFMILLVISSVILLILDVRSDIGPWGGALEAFAVSVFILEYLLRLWVWSDARRIIIEHYEHALFLDQPFRSWPALKAIAASKWAYMTTPLAIIDLLAILPSYRPFRVLRLFLLFRLFKLFRYARSVNEFARVLAEKRFELGTLAMFVGFIVFASSTAIYVFEADSPGSNIHSFFDAIYWSMVTLSTVGYGDIIPTTEAGRTITLLLIISGLGVLAFSTSIIVAALTEKLGLLRHQRVWTEIERHRGTTVIFGYGRIGEMLADELADSTGKLIIVDKHPERVELARSKGLLVIETDIAEQELEGQRTLLERAKAVVCATNDDRTNAFVTLTARSINPKLEIVTRANRKGVRKKLLLAGANHVVEPFEMVALAAAQSVGHPVAFDALHNFMGHESRHDVDIVPIPPDSTLTQCTLQDIDFAAARLILFGVLVQPDTHLQRGFALSNKLSNKEFRFNPKADFHIEEGDILVVLGHSESIQQFRDAVESNSLDIRPTHSPKPPGDPA